MCLAIPMRVVKIDGDEALVKTDGLEKRANISLVKGIKVGDYVLIHAGFAIERVKEGEAKKTLKVLRDLNI